MFKYKLLPCPSLSRKLYTFFYLYLIVFTFPCCDKLSYLDVQLVLVKWGRMVELLASDLLLLSNLLIKLLVADFPLLSAGGLLHPSLFGHHV